MTESDQYRRPPPVSPEERQRVSETCRRTRARLAARAEQIKHERAPEREPGEDDDQEENQT